MPSRTCQLSAARRRSPTTEVSSESLVGKYHSPKLVGVVAHAEAALASGVNSGGALMGASVHE